MVKIAAAAQPIAVAAAVTIAAGTAALTHVCHIAVMDPAKGGWVKIAVPVHKIADHADLIAVMDHANPVKTALTALLIAEHAHLAVMVHANHG